MTPLFAHRHYCRIAEIIATCPDPEMREGMARLFGKGLRGSNPNYNEDRFIAAATCQPVTGRDRARNK